MNDGFEIVAVKVATLQAPLPVPVVFGNWVMRHREFAICGVKSAGGVVGISYCYTRDGPIREIVDRLIAPHYLGGDASQPEALFDPAAWSNNAILASGVGHRAISLVDVATWDLAAKLAHQPIEAVPRGDTGSATWHSNRRLPTDHAYRRTRNTGADAARRRLAPIQASDRADVGGNARTTSDSYARDRRRMARHGRQLGLQEVGDADRLHPNA